METATVQIEWSRQGDVAKIHYYRPIRHYAGRVLKYAGSNGGIPGHREFFEPFFASNGDANTNCGCAFLPGVVIADEYLGDRIYAHDMGPVDRDA